MYLIYLLNLFYKLCVYYLKELYLKDIDCLFDIDGWYLLLNGLWIYYFVFYEYVGKFLYKLFYLRILMFYLLGI